MPTLLYMESRAVDAAPTGEQVASPLVESALIAGAKRRDGQAWAAIYDQHFPTLYRYAYARLRSKEEAEDVAAQAFLDALKGIDAYEDRGRPLLAWLYRITHNLVVERLRRDQRARRAAALPDGSPTHYPGPEVSIDNLVLLDALAQLTPDQQEVIILRYLMQMTTKEVSALIGKSDAAIFSLQVRAIAGLKRRLSPPDGDAGAPGKAGRSRAGDRA